MAGIITTVMVVTAGAILINGTAARTQFAPADVEQPEYGPAIDTPSTLEHLWAHASEGTDAPLTTKGNLVTVDPDGTLIGRDAGSGEQQWSYSHSGRFCAATFYADVLVAAFDGASGCSDVTSLDPTAQQYSNTRQSAFPDMMELTSTWRHALALSPERLEIWRDDLVRTIEYGAVEAPQESGMQPRTGCALGSAALTDDRFAVAERCPGDDSMRLTVSETVPEDNREPEEIASDVTGADDLWVLAVTDEGTLGLVRRGADWAVEWFTSPERYSPVLMLPGEPALTPAQETLAGDDTQLRWFDGAATHAFDLTTGTHAWTAPVATGPGLTGGWSPDPEERTARDWVLVPSDGRFVAVDHSSGAEIRWLDSSAGDDNDDDDNINGSPDADPGTDRGEGVEATSVIGLSQIGDILYERRSGEIHAYKIRS